MKVYFFEMEIELVMHLIWQDFIQAQAEQSLACVSWTKTPGSYTRTYTWLYTRNYRQFSKIIRSLTSRLKIALLAITGFNWQCTSTFIEIESVFLIKVSD